MGIRKLYRRWIEFWEAHAKRSEEEWMKNEYPKYNNGER